MWKDKTKEEKAVWLIETILHGKLIIPDEGENYYWVKNKENIPVSKAEDFISSYEGFFKMWNSVLERYGKHLCSRIGSGDKNFEWMWIIGTHESGDIQLGARGYGPIKEAAFCAAIYEVYKVIKGE